MASEESVTLHFIIPKDRNTEETSDEMKIAFQTCVDNDLLPQWIREEQCSSMNPTKQDVFVFEEFKGPIFNQFQKLKCVLLGPRCLTSCLMDKCPIPESNSPVFTTAMRDLVITTTNFIGSAKEDIINKVQYMGGLYSAKLITGTTHLVAKDVLSVKYEKAVEKGLPVMTEQWVNAVWDSSCKKNVHAKDPEFDVYKCPVFHGLTVTCSNLPRNQKEDIRNLVNTNGGTFSGQLECEITKILVINNPSGEKYKYACDWKLPRVLPSWIHESVKAGYAVSVEPHRIEKRGAPENRCSTPNEDESRMWHDFSVTSQFSSIPGNATHVDESTVNTTVQSFLAKVTTRRVPESCNKEIPAFHATLEKLDLREAKKSGAFLDGCNVYLSGFNPEQTEKLRRILNGGGATRFNEISDSVTHILVGRAVASDRKSLQESGCRPYILSVDWLLESIKRKCPAPEEQFLCTNILLPSTEPPSPLSKKGLQMLSKPNEKPVPPAFNLDDKSDEELKRANRSKDKNESAGIADAIVQQYLNNADDNGEKDQTSIQHFLNNAKPGDSRQDVNDEEKNKREPAKTCGADCVDRPLHGSGNTSQETDVTQDFTQCTENSVIPIFSGLTFLIIDFEEELKEDIHDAIVARGGRVVNKSFRGIADYAIVPVEGAKFSQTASEVVTYPWVEDCVSQNELLPLMYYHRPISLNSDKRPLSDCVIGISSYMGSEREFILSVAKLLGADAQDMFARKANERKNVLASTHLICSEPGSQKYNAAVKWKLPTVSHEWLLACARESRHVNEDPYVVSEDQSTKSSIPAPKSSTTTTTTASVSTPSNISNATRKLPTPTNTNTPNSVQEDGCKLISKRVEELQSKTAMAPPSSPRTPRRMLTPKIGGDGFSQESPLNIPRLENTPKPGWPTDLSQPTPKGPFHINTPETPYGQVLKPNPSPETRKNWKRWIDNFPDLGRERTPPVKRRNSTPLSELKRRCWEMILPKKNPEEDTVRRTVKQSCESELSEQSPSSISVAGPSSASSSPMFKKSDAAETSQREKDPVLAAKLEKEMAKLNEFLDQQKKQIDEPDRPLMKRMRTSDPPEPHDIENVPINLGLLGKDSQGVVEWMDPMEMRKLRLAEETKMVEPEHTEPRFFKFMLSGIQEREEFEEKIRALGGEMTDQPLFDPAATHLLCNRPVRSEKLLASIASGKWVLHRSFMDASQKANKFLKEDEYEWGNPSAITLMRDLKPGSVEHDLALAAHRWRRRLSKDPGGAFVGVRALVCMSREREEPFKRLILAGGGQLLDFSKLKEATHCFVELNKVSLPIELSVLVKNRIPCVPPLYLNDYLIKSPAPQAHNSVVPEYRKLMQS